MPLEHAVLVASCQVEPPPPCTLFVGELSRDGQASYTRGILPMVATARGAGLAGLRVPRDFVRLPPVGAPCTGGRSYVRARHINAVITRLGQTL